MSAATFTVAVVQDGTRMFDFPAVLKSLKDRCRQAADAKIAPSETEET